VGHAGDGNVHCNIIRLGGTDEEWHEALEASIADLIDLGLSMGGTVSGEHGLGYTKRPVPRKESRRDASRVDEGYLRGSSTPTVFSTLTRFGVEASITSLILLNLLSLIHLSEPVEPPKKATLTERVTALEN